MAGNAALYKGDLKLVKDLPPFGDNAWHLYDVRRDPTESHDLQASEPEAFRTMQSDLQAYFIKNGVIALPRMLWPVLLTLVAILLAVVGGIFYLWRRWRIMPAHA